MRWEGELRPGKLQRRSYDGVSYPQAPVEAVGNHSDVIPIWRANRLTPAEVRRLRRLAPDGPPARVRWDVVMLLAAAIVSTVLVAVLPKQRPFWSVVAIVALGAFAIRSAGAYPRPRKRCGGS